LCSVGFRLHRCTSRLRSQGFCLRIRRPLRILSAVFIEIVEKKRAKTRGSERGDKRLVRELVSARPVARIDWAFGMYILVTVMMVRRRVEKMDEKRSDLSILFYVNGDDRQCL
jgi:hypothetical protein